MSRVDKGVTKVVRERCLGFSSADVQRELFTDVQGELFVDTRAHTVCPYFCSCLGFSIQGLGADV